MKSNHPDSLTIQQYLAGTLDPKLMHALEKQALEDPFLFEALEGYSKVSTSDSDHGLSILQRQLHERIMHLQENKKVYDFTWQRLSVAATAAVMFISAGIIFWMNSQKHEPQIASNSKQVEVSVTPLDSINEILNVPDRQKEKVESSSKTVVRAVPDVYLHARKKQYTVQLPPSKRNPLASSNLNLPVEKDKEIPSTLKPSGSSEAIVSNQVINSFQGRAAGVNVTGDTVSLSEVVVAEYNAVKKTNIRGASTIKTEDLGRNRISGQIVSKSGGEPLPGVVVKVKGTNKASATNVDGEFSLDVDSLAETLQVTYVGFESKEIKIKAGQNIKVALSSDMSSLSEVVVTGYGSKRAKNELQPVFGWEFYRKYLEENIRQPKDEQNMEGKVVIGFFVNKDGKPINLRIIRGLSKACDAEAMRLIEEGPNWKSISDGKAKETKVEVDFRGK